MLDMHAQLEALLARLDLPPDAPVFLAREAPPRLPAPVALCTGLCFGAPRGASHCGEVQCWSAEAGKQGRIGKPNPSNQLSRPLAGRQGAHGIAACVPMCRPSMPGKSRAPDLHACR
jgi:hypothetical protein